MKFTQAERDNKDEELGALKCKSPADLWTDDLDRFLADYDVYEKEEERKDNNEGPTAKGKKGVGKAARASSRNLNIQSGTEMQVTTGASPPSAQTPHDC